MRRAPRTTLVTVCCLVVLAALAGCGGGSERTSDDPGRAAVDRLVAAVAEGDDDRIWDLVSEATRSRLETKERVADAVERRLRPFAGTGYRTVVSRLVTDQFGVVAIANRAGITALVLRKDGDDLRVDIGSALRVEPIGPLPRAYDEPPPPQVGVRVKGGVGAAQGAVLWVDGAAAFDPRLAGDASAATLFANLPRPFTPGRHTVVAIFATLAEAGATAWRFTVRG